jgi:ssDNA-binding Zn-finger/Zn-ribbon topoisomerase 1
MLSKMFTAIEEEPDQEAFADEYRDLVFDDIQAARESLSGAIPNYSSMEGLEDIPTMEKNPEDLAEGETPAVVHETCPNCGGSNTFSTVDEFGEVRCDECGALDPRDEEWENPIAEGPSSVPPATNAGKELAAGNCPKCGSLTTPSVLDPSVLVCSNCGWDGEQLPHLSEQSEEIQGLEQSFNAPSVEHPLGPHTGSEEELEQELYTSGRFVNLAKWPSNPVWGVEVAPAAGQRDPMPGDLATIQQKSKAFNRPVPVTLVEDMGGAWTFKNGHHPA